MQCYKKFNIFDAIACVILFNDLHKKCNAKKVIAAREQYQLHLNSEKQRYL